MTAVEQLREKQMAWLRQIHEHPELSYEEYETTRLVKQVLTDAGIQLIDTGMPTGAVATIGHGPGHVIGLRSDMDALPIQEETDLPYASREPGKMHACGHDFHTVTMLGAALMLKEMEDQLPGRAVVVFQPAEESGGVSGGTRVAESGATDDAELFLALHSYPHFEAGTLGIKEGPVMASVDAFKVTLKGVGSHAATPHKGVDPIPGMSALVLNLQTIVSRVLSPFETGLVTVAHAQAGNTWNVIPTEAVIEGTVRAMDQRVRERIKAAFYRMAEHTAETYGLRAEIEWLAGPGPVVNDERLCAMAREVATGLGFVIDRQEDTMGGEDFSEYLRIPHKRPGLFVRVGTGGGYANHHPKFTVDPEAMYPASVFFRDLAIRCMERGAEG